MSKGEGQNLPANRLVEANLLDLPDKLVERTIAMAMPALERQALLEGVLTIRDTTAFFVSSPPYNEIDSAKLRHKDPEDVSYRAEGSSAIGYILPDTVWGNNRTEIKSKIKARREIEKAKSHLVAESPLDAGALLTANEFGGIDVSDRELTARHLVLRAIIIHKTKLNDIGEVVRAGLLDPVLARLLSQEFADYIKPARTLIESLVLVPDEIKASTGPGILEGVVAQAESFMEEHSRTIETAAHVVGNPESAKSALDALKTASSGPTNFTFPPKL